ncbi:MAG TPA: hypothetical protein VHX65_18465 [Pirellulales bacterium]|nr:hypothetical protein [Pirellulales bacterium]
MSKCARFVGLGLLGLVFAVGSVAWNSSIVAPPVAQAQEPWHHPHLHQSLDSLRVARQDLLEAHHNFGGHRDDAIRAIDAAIYHLDMCIRYDR